MEFNYKTISHWELRNYLEKKQYVALKERPLYDRSILIWYAPVNKSWYQLLEIASVVYVVPIETAAKTFASLEYAPTPPKVEIKPDFDGWLLKPMRFNYTLMTCKYFDSVAMRKGLRVISEKILNDGRVSVIYSSIPDRRYHPHYHFDFYLIIGRMVFTYVRLDYLLNIEAHINDGSLNCWRPELYGKMDLFPDYHVSTINQYHNRFLKKPTLIKKVRLKNRTVAKLYHMPKNSAGCFMTLTDKIYFFKNVDDCEIILSKLFDMVAIGPTSSLDSEEQKHNSKIISARLSRYMSSNVSRVFSERLLLTEKGFLTGLNAIL